MDEACSMKSLRPLFVHISQPYPALLKHFRINTSIYNNIVCVHTGQRWQSRSPGVVSQDVSRSSWTLAHSKEALHRRSYLSKDEINNHHIAANQAFSRRNTAALSCPDVRLMCRSPGSQRTLIESGTQPPAHQDMI